jgi:hypothetical protein
VSVLRSANLTDNCTEAGASRPSAWSGLPASRHGACLYAEAGQAVRHLLLPPGPPGEWEEVEGSDARAEPQGMLKKTKTD